MWCFHPSLPIYSIPPSEFAHNEKGVAVLSSTCVFFSKKKAVFDTIQGALLSWFLIPTHDSYSTKDALRYRSDILTGGTVIRHVPCPWHVPRCKIHVSLFFLKSHYLTSPDQAMHETIPVLGSYESIGILSIPWYLVGWLEKKSLLKKWVLPTLTHRGTSEVIWREHVIFELCVLGARFFSNQMMDMC